MAVVQCLTDESPNHYIIGQILELPIEQLCAATMYATTLLAHTLDKIKWVFTIFFKPQVILATKFIPKKCAILLIEFQNEFATEGGKIYGQVQNRSSQNCEIYLLVGKRLPWITEACRNLWGSMKF